MKTGWHRYRTSPDIGWIKSSEELKVGDTVYVNDMELGLSVWVTVNKVTEVDTTWTVDEFMQGMFGGQKTVQMKTLTAHITVHKGGGKPEGANPLISVFLD